MFGKTFLKNAKRQKLNNQRRRALFIRKKYSNKQLKTSGPDENYGLAEELPPESSYEDLTNMKMNFINEIKNMDRGSITSIHFSILRCKDFNLDVYICLK